MGMSGRRATRALARAALPRHEAGSPGAVNVHIEHLVLDGFPVGDRYAVGDAVSAQLGRLLQEGGVPQAFRRSGQLDALTAPDKVLQPRPGVDFGTSVAEAVYAGLTAQASRIGSRSPAA
jgi:hypothetical protein